MDNQNGSRPGSHRWRHWTRACSAALVGAGIPLSRWFLWPLVNHRLLAAGMAAFWMVLACTLTIALLRLQSRADSRMEEMRQRLDALVRRESDAHSRSESVWRQTERLAVAGRLAATIAHEINNPLEAVNNLLYLARHDPNKRDKYLRLAEQEVECASAIANQTLGMVREGSSAAVVKVTDVLNQALQLCLPKLKTQGIQIEKQCDSSVEIRGFAGELRQLFSNLILNSVDAMGEGGRLRLRVACAYERTQNNERRAGVRITVADNGSGIEPAAMSHIFEPFYTTKEDIGTGLGLWLSQGIVQKHGGSIRVRSRRSPGASGAVFSVFLPEVCEKIAVA